MQTPRRRRSLGPPGPEPRRRRSETKASQSDERVNNLESNFIGKYLQRGSAGPDRAVASRGRESAQETDVDRR